MFTASDRAGTLALSLRCQAFTAIFAMEAALKITALGLFRYLKDRWNCFDLFVVGGTASTCSSSASVS